MSAILEDVSEPPQEEFWDRYNKRFEFPISTTIAVLVHVAVAALVIVTLVHFMNRSSKNGGMAVQLVPDLGMDDDGLGRDGSGGVDDPKIESDSDPWRASLALLPSPTDLPKVQEDIRKLFDDESGTLPVSPANAPQYKELDKLLREKLMQPPGAKKGEGNDAGRGNSGQKGTGPGGDSKEDSRKRSLRWVLRFNTSSGRDYLDQLAAMNATVLIPVPPANKDAILFPDLKDRTIRRMATDDDLKRLAGQVRFSDGRVDSVKGVCEALGVADRPTAFWAFFPKPIEAELLRKEIGHLNRRPEEIEETVFRIRVANGKVEIAVAGQTAKK